MQHHINRGVNFVLEERGVMLSFDSKLVRVMESDMQVSLQTAF